MAISAPASGRIGRSCAGYQRRRGGDDSKPDIKAQIAGELYKAFERLGADEELLAIVGSWRDTLDDDEVLELLQDYNAGQPTLQPRQ